MRGLRSVSSRVFLHEFGIMFRLSKRFHPNIHLDYNIMAKKNSFTTAWDEQTKTAYAYSSTGFVSYDDERAICDKIEYAMDNQLLGCIIWEISGDLMPDLSTPLLDEVNRRLNEPTIRCDTIVEAKAAVEAAKPKTASPTAAPSIAICPQTLTGNIVGPCCKSFAMCKAGVMVGSLVECLDGTLYSEKKGICDYEAEVVCDSDCGSEVVSSPTVTTATSTSSTIFQPTSEGAIPIEGGVSVSIPNNDTSQKYYPNYGASAECRNDGNAPEWITTNMMKSSKLECCESYFFPSSLEDCKANHPFYPNFQMKSCANDGKQPKWMSGSYLVETMTSCCQNFYRDSELQQRCLGR